MICEESAMDLRRPSSFDLLRCKLVPRTLILDTFIVQINDITYISSILAASPRMAEEGEVVSELQTEDVKKEDRSRRLHTPSVRRIVSGDIQ